MNVVYLVLWKFLLITRAFADGDFFIYGTQPSRYQAVRSKFEAIPATDCRARISHIMCLIDHKIPQVPNQPRACADSSPSFSPRLERLYDEMPAPLQKVFCSLDVIFVEPGMSALAYAGVAKDNTEGKTTGAVLGICQSLLDKDWAAQEVVTWKEQKVFGFLSNPFSHKAEGPLAQISISGNLSALKYAVTHEFGHILDITNKANNFVCRPGATCNVSSRDPADFANMIPTSQSWGALTWASVTTPSAANHFPLWDSLCFYGCRGKQLSAQDIESFYTQLQTTQFVTTYAAVSPFEDFAESFAFFILSNDPNFTYTITTAQGTYPLAFKWASLASKKKFMQNFYSPNLKYPVPGR